MSAESEQIALAIEMKALAKKQRETATKMVSDAQEMLARAWPRTLPKKEK